MNCERLREQLPALLDDRLIVADAAEIRSHLERCAACQRELHALRQTLAALDTLPLPKPSPRLRTHVYAAIAAEHQALRSAPVPVATQSSPTSKPPARPFWFWAVAPLAAGALVVLGFSLGIRSGSATATGSSSAQTAAALATQRELAALRTQVESMSQLVGYAVLHQSRSSNERLRGILTSAQMENPDSKAINDLISALALDPSTNVRLNALDALYAHADQEAVRAGVLNSLPRETSPLVQVSIIDFLVATRDREAAPALQKLSDSSQTDRDVRDAAKRALNQL